MPPTKLDYCIARFGRKRRYTTRLSSYHLLASPPGFSKRWQLLPRIPLALVGIHLEKSPRLHQENCKFAFSAFPSRKSGKKRKKQGNYGIVKQDPRRSSTKSMKSSRTPENRGGGSADWDGEKFGRGNQGSEKKVRTRTDLP